MNTSLRRISVAVMVLVVLLLANATFTQVFTADGLRSDPRNQRVLLDEYSRQRGQISAGGQLLAYSVSTDERFRFLRSVRTLSAEGRGTAWVVSIMPFLLAAIAELMKPGWITGLGKDPFGQQLIIAAFVLMVVGIFWLKRLVNINV